MKINQKIHWLFFVAGIIDILFADFVTKLLVVKEILKKTVFIKNFFYIIPAQRNEGIAFGIHLPKIIQIIGTIIILIILFQFALKYLSKEEKPSFLKHWLLGAVIGGGIGNLIDRILYGSVVDFIVLGPIHVFNIADIGITIGLILLFATMVIDEKKVKLKKKKL